MSLTQSWMFGISLASACLITIASNSGCSQQQAVAVEGALTETLKTAHVPLRDELGLLISNGDSPDNIAHEIYEQLNGRTSFLKEAVKLFEYLDTEPLRERTRKLIASPATPITFIDIESIHHLRMTYASQQEQLIELLKNDPPLGLSPHQAFANDFEFLIAFDTAHALLLLTALEDIVAQKPRDALKPVSDMFKLCRKLEEVPVATTRAHAANLRRRTLRVVERIVTQPATDRACYEELATGLQLHYEQWVPYANIIRGERAMGMMVYEQVRQGEFLSLLSPEEFQRLKEEKLLDVTRSSVRRNIDLDETFFLFSQKSLLAVAHEPYYKRVPSMEALRSRMTKLTESPEYPYIACKFLLHDMEQVQLALAQDRACFEAWMVILQTALNGSPPENMPINSVSGLPFDLSQDAGSWVISNLQTATGDEMIIVPVQ